MPPDLIASVRVPTLVIDGEESHGLMRQAAHAFAEGLPAGTYRTLPGQGHVLVPEALAPVLTEFFLGRASWPTSETGASSTANPQ